MKTTYLFLIVALIISCKNSQPETTPICKAETTANITFQNDVKAILDKNCLSCHSTKEHSGGVKLEDISDIKFWANSGELYDQIIPFGGNPPRMPKGAKLTDCEVLIIKKWIDSGLN
ncbi:MAG: hypothetical protein V4585_17850 [Bacteroidota bacterium]